MCPAVHHRGPSNLRCTPSTALRLGLRADLQCPCALSQYLKERLDASGCDAVKDKFLLLTSEGHLARPMELLIPSPYNPCPVQEILQDAFKCVGGFLPTKP